MLACLVMGNMAATYWLDEVIDFEAVDNNERKFAWYGKEPGIVRPMLRWETTLAKNVTELAAAKDGYVRLISKSDR